MLKLCFLILLLPSLLKAQPYNCTFKAPIININFGKGTPTDLNSASSYFYSRVSHSCPSDGHYTYAPYTSDCFRGDWITLAEDHTPGDASGNMMIVNSSYRTGEFFGTFVPPLEPNKTYEFSIWMLNVCKPTDKCPYPLLPNLIIRLLTAAGKTVMTLETGELIRKGTADWSQHKVMFKSPAGNERYYLSMVNTAPGGCGNDFALDDIIIRECEVQETTKTKSTSTSANKKLVAVKPGTKPTEVAKKDAIVNSTPVTINKPATTKEVGDKPKSKPVINSKPPAKTSTDLAKNRTPVKQNAPVKESGPASSTIPQIANASVPGADSVSKPVVKAKPQVFAPPPPALRERENPLVKKIETEAGEIKIDLYDNGEIDGDTVTIYHNNTMVVSRARLSQKPVTLRIAVDPDQPHHELVMVANNLGSIPPNTSLMIVTAGTKRYEVYISSNEQNNAKVVVDLKK